MGIVVGVAFLVVAGCLLIARATPATCDSSMRSMIPPPQDPGVRVIPYDPDILLIDCRTVPPLVYTAENISLANAGEKLKQELSMMANMTKEDREAYMDGIAKDADEKVSTRQSSSAGEAYPLDDPEWSVEYMWGQNSGIGGGTWPTSGMQCYDSGGSGQKNWRCSSPDGDGPLEAYARDDEPCTFTWISCAAAGSPIHSMTGEGQMFMRIEMDWSLDCYKFSSDPSVGANIGFYHCIYYDGDLTGYVPILQGTKYQSYSGHPAANGYVYLYDWHNSYKPEICMRNWCQNYGEDEGDFWSISYRDIGPSGDLWYTNFEGRIYTADV